MSLRGGRTSRRSNLLLTTDFSAKWRLLRDEHPRNDMLVVVCEGTYIFMNPKNVRIIDSPLWIAEEDHEGERKEHACEGEFCT